MRRGDGADCEPARRKRGSPAALGLSTSDKVHRSASMLPPWKWRRAASQSQLAWARREEAEMGAGQGQASYPTKPLARCSHDWVGNRLSLVTV